MFLLRGSGAKGQEVRLYCSLCSARLQPSLCPPWDAPLKGQLHPECAFWKRVGAARYGAACVFNGSILILFGWRGTACFDNYSGSGVGERGTLTVVKLMEEHPRFILHLRRLEHIILVLVSNQFSFGHALKSVLLLCTTLTFHKEVLTSSSLEGILYFSWINEFLNAEENPLRVCLDCCLVP